MGKGNKLLKYSLCISEDIPYPFCKDIEVEPDPCSPKKSLPRADNKFVCLGKKSCSRSKQFLKRLWRL